MLCRTLRKEYGAYIEKTKYGWTGKYVMNECHQYYNMDVDDGVFSEEDANKEFSRFLIEIIQDTGAVYDDYNYDHYDDDMDDLFYD